MAELPAAADARASEPIEDGYPIVVRVTGRPVLVVGGGPVALRKVHGLLVAGAAVTVVSPEVVDGFAALIAVGRVTHVARRYEPDDQRGTWLVIAATGDPIVQQQVYDDGERAGVLVNCADEPERCSFILPAVHRRGPVIVAVSTQGRSPALAGQLRDRLAAAIPDDIEQIAMAAAARRREIHDSGRSTEDVAWPDLLDPGAPPPS